MSQINIHIGEGKDIDVKIPVGPLAKPSTAIKSPVVNVAKQDTPKVDEKPLVVREMTRKQGGSMR